MPLNNKIRSIHLTVRLTANTPSFEVAADERVTAPRSDASFHQSGAGSTFEDLLREVLQKIGAAYRSQNTITLCVDDDDIKPEGNC